MKRGAPGGSFRTLPSLKSARTPRNAYIDLWLSVVAQAYGQGLRDGAKDGYREGFEDGFIDGAVFVLGADE